MSTANANCLHVSARPAPGVQPTLANWEDGKDFYLFAYPIGMGGREGYFSIRDSASLIAKGIGFVQVYDCKFRFVFQARLSA